MIIVADRCPWHALLVDSMGARLREQGFACGVIGLVEQGLLDAANIAGLRRLADKTGGAWDLANGRELPDAIYTLGLHLYHKVGNLIATCEIVVLDHGHMTLFRDGVETGVRRLTDALAEEHLRTDLLFHWRSMPVSRLDMAAKEATIRSWSPPRLDRAASPRAADPVDSQRHDTVSPSYRPEARSTDPGTTRLGRKAVNPAPRAEQRSQSSRLGPAIGHSATIDRIIQWGLWLSGGALLSALSLLAKK